MTLSSHRLKIEERKVFRKLLTTLAIFIAAFIILIYAGIPLLTKTIIFFASFGQKNQTTNTSETVQISRPVLDTLPEATNSATITVSGVSDKEATVKLLVNEKMAIKVLSDKDAKFVAKNLKLTEGENTIVAVTLKNNQESSPSSPLMIVYKKNPPKLEISTPSDGQKFISEEKNITISGETDPGNKVTVNERLAIVDQNGKFNYKATLSDGDNKFKVVATDVAGNQTIIERKTTYTP